MRKRLRLTQLIAVLLFFDNSRLNKGHIAQVSTGEGKTVLIAFISALKFLQGANVDIITSNEVLATEAENSMK